jgi:hypothetical protein
MRNLKKVRNHIQFLLASAAAVTLIVSGVSAIADHTPTGINGYNIEELSGDLVANLKSTEVLSNEVNVELCIDMPTRDPWNPYATLTVEDRVIHNIAVALIDPKNPKTMESQNRCYLFTFPVTPEDLKANTGTIKLEKLWLELGNGYFSDEVITEVKTRMSTISPEVVFDIVPNFGEGGGGVAIEVISKPENMSETDVVKLINELSIDEITTTWQMEIDL